MILDQRPQTKDQRPKTSLALEKGLNMDGILVIDKPPGITSFRVVDKIKKKFNFRKVGHGGTLDPFATGVLVILINKATKIFDLLSATSKCYSGKMMLGIETDTQDRTGRIICNKDSSISEKNESNEFDFNQIENIRKSFTGKIEQVPPIYSAIKHKGRRAYELARKGISVELEKRKVK